MFGKLMSISDDLMWKYFTLLSFRPIDEIAASAQPNPARQGRNPRDAKVMLAQEIVARFHGAICGGGGRWPNSRPASREGGAAGRHLPEVSPRPGRRSAIAHVAQAGEPRAFHGRRRCATSSRAVCGSTASACRGQGPEAARRAPTWCRWASGSSRV
jgi:hypothetical protein